MSRIITAKDHIGANEKSKSGLLGEVTFGTGLHRVPYIDIYGNKSYKYDFREILFKDKNIIPIGGYQFAFNKLFNIALDSDSNLKVGDLNDENPGMKIGVPKARYKSTYIDYESTTNSNFTLKKLGVKIPATNSIFGFMVGDGGSAADNMTALAPNYKNRTLYNPIPFRTEEKKYTTIQEGVNTYFGGTQISTTQYRYYVKRIDPSSPPHIVNTWIADGAETDVDDSVFASTSTNAIETYVEMGLVIDATDCRSNELTTAPRINEIGLVSGWYNEEEKDYECIRLFSHFTRPSITLATGDKIEIIYRIYAR